MIGRRPAVTAAIARGRRTKRGGAWQPRLAPNRLVASGRGFFGATLVPASAAPYWVQGDWTRVAVDGLGGRSVGLARRRRGMLSAPSRALRDVLHDVVATDGPSQPGVHPAGRPDDAGSTR